jgi:hypothetical protein
MPGMQAEHKIFTNPHGQNAANLISPRLALAKGRKK